MTSVYICMCGEFMLTNISRGTNFGFNFKNSLRSTDYTDRTNPDTMVRVAVIGAGMVGLCSAINVQKELPEAEVTVIADKFSTDTTSFGAGGFFRPFMPDIAKGVDLKVAEQWVRDSWKYYASLARSDLAKETGQTLVPGMIAYRTPQDQQYDLLKELVGDFHRVDLEHLQKLNLDTYTYAYAFTTIIVQTPKFLDWLMKKFVASGGKVQERTVKSLKELSSSFDIVVNCCGPRAQELLDDKSCFPIKGHIVMVRAPWQKQFFYGEGDIYLIPHDDKLIIGGIKDKDNGSMTKYPYVREHILSRALALFPQLKGAPIISEWVGLRPGRDGVRLELELVDGEQGRKLPVVHNYGHGGHGITLGWGCALHATRLVKEALTGVTTARL